MKIDIETSWHQQLKDELDKKYFKDLMVFLENEYLENEDKIFPNKNLLFQAFAQCPFEKVKVVILGQDPYPTKGHANGLCFSVESDVRPLPKSLLNIFKEIESDLNIEIPENGNLLRWAEQGVLLLNSVLSVREGEANSHSKKGWEQFTDAVITKLNQKEGVVYLLWGSKAQEKAKNVDEDLNCVLNSVHPSPLSSYRGFFGCKHFSRANVYLEKIGKEKIDW
jgi:uracil-DNA glycosylase